MTGRTHLFLGLAAGFAVASTVPPSVQPHEIIAKVGCVFLAVVAALLPDIDHPRSIISGYLPGIGAVVRMGASHRTWTHSVLFAAALCLVAYAGAGAVFPQPAIAVAAGVLSHLAADMLTPQGVPLLLPVSRRAFRLLPYPVLWASAFFLEALALVVSVAVIGLVLWGKL